MSTTTRTVRHLRLRASGAGAIHRAALLLEDALRTASLPDVAGRIVVVRRLALGRIDSRGPPQTLALQLERGVAQLSAECVYAGAPNAREAPAVWFRDALDAHTRLALNLAAGHRADAWYWPLAVKAWRPGAPLLQALREIVFSLAALPEAPAALPQWTAAMVSAGHAQRLIDALEVEDAAPLAHAAGLSVPGPVSAHRRSQSPPRPRAEPHARPPTPQADTQVAFDAQSTRSAKARIDPRYELLDALLRTAGARGIAALPHPLTPFSIDPTPDHSDRGSAAAYAQQPARQPPRSLGSPAHAELRSKDRATPSPSDKSEHGPSASTGQTEPRSALQRDATDANPHHISIDPEQRAHPASSLQENGGGEGITATASSWVLPGASTQAGGLLFLIPVLQRLGYRDWLDVQPEWARFDIARRMLAAVLARLRIAQEDPAWHLARYRPAVRSAPRRFVAPMAWRDSLGARNGSLRAAEHEGVHTLWDPSGRLLLGAWTGPCPRALMRGWRDVLPHAGERFDSDRAALVTAAWLVAVRRWLRRFAAIGLADLVLRPAAVALTPTHADVCFEMGQADLRIRRAGLDIDPGWVPWFGRVVSFHYGAEGGAV